MEPTVRIPARLALMIARNLAERASFAQLSGHQREMDMLGSWKSELVDALVEQCSMKEFEAAAAAVKLEEGGY